MSLLVMRQYHDRMNTRGKGKSIVMRSEMIMLQVVIKQYKSSCG